MVTKACRSRQCYYNNCSSDLLCKCSTCCTALQITVLLRGQTFPNWTQEHSRAGGAGMQQVEDSRAGGALCRHAAGEHLRLYKISADIWHELSCPTSFPILPPLVSQHPFYPPLLNCTLKQNPDLSKQKSNKLVKLGEAIANSKSETINHQLTGVGAGRCCCI